MLLKLYYKVSHKGGKDEDIPYYFCRLIIGEIIHLFRKGVCQNIAPNCVLNPVRVFCIGYVVSR